MVRTSRYANLDIPQCDIWTFLFERPEVQRLAHQDIFVDAESSRTYKTQHVKHAASSFGRFLMTAWGWKKGDVLAFFTANSIDVPPLVWGCLWAGGIVTTANPAYNANELSYQLQDAKAKAIVTQAIYLPTVLEAAKAVGIPQERIILIDEVQQTSFLHLSDFLDSKIVSKEPGRRETQYQDIAFLVYSSGTTGRPKGVMLTHQNIISNILMLKHETGKMAQDNTNCAMLAFLPLYHIYGLVRLMHDPFYYGITTIVMKRFDIESFCALVEKHRVTFAHVVPPVLLALSKHAVVSKYDLSSLKMMSSGAAPLTWPLTQAVYKRIGVPVKQAYGLTETSPTTHSQEWSDWAAHPGSVGRLLASQTIKYIDHSGQEVALGEEGEVCIRGPNVFKGYWQNKSATENAFTEDGFFKTGDVGWEDERGNLFITDRAKELIKYKGFQVAPAELEGILTSHPKVADAAVIGVWKESEATELPKAYIVLTPSAEEMDHGSTAREIEIWMAKQTSHHKRLRGGIQIIDTIPKSPSGKILRRILRDQASLEEKKAQAKL